MTERLPNDPDDAPDPRFSLANERTLLAWVRTALGLIAGGVALPSLIPLPLGERQRALIGVPLMALGAVASVWAMSSFRSRERRLREGRSMLRSEFPTVLSLGVGIAGGIAIVLALLAGS